MKKTILSLVVLTLLVLSGTLSAQISPAISVQGTNATIRWASTPGESYMVLYRRAFHPAYAWTVVGTNIAAGSGIETLFQHIGGVPHVPTEYTGGGSGGGTPGSPAAATLAAPAGSTSTNDTEDKAKKNDSGLPGFPALPDEKAIEKWLKDMLKEYERMQREGGGAQTFSALMASSLTAEQATNNSMGYYAVTRTTDDTDGDGLPDWWEAAHGLKLLVNDAAEDPDGDGVPNLAEYAYGTDPRDPNSKPLIYVTFTSPVNTNTYLPVVQLTGSINLNVRTLTFDVTNAAGVQAGLEGFVTKRIVVPGAGFTNSPSRYTNSFQCFDVPLTNGANTIGLRFTDAYGLTFTTTVSFTADFTASPAAPVGTVLWPASGTWLATDTFTVRGRLDNPTASVVAQMTINDEPQEIGGLVERDGTFWIESLPVPTNNVCTLVFTDAAGKSSTNELIVKRAPVNLSFDPPAGADLWNSTVTLTGTVDNPRYGVSVNGVNATMGSGTWTASNVPVNSGGVASFTVRGVWTGPPPGLPTIFAAPVETAFDADKPPRIVVASYTKRLQDDNPGSDTGYTNRQTVDWTYDGIGGSGSEYRYFEYKYAPGTYYGLAVTQQTDYVTYPYPGTNGTGIATGALNTASSSPTPTPLTFERQTLRPVGGTLLLKGSPPPPSQRPPAGCCFWCR